MSPTQTLTPLAQALANEFDRESIPNYDKKISVNPVVAEVASWYEKIRNAMDYRDGEGILCATIERILRRRLLLGGKRDGTASSLIRELMWGRYFPPNSIPESIVAEVSERISLYIEVYDQVTQQHKLNKSAIYDWMLGILAADITRTLNPNKDTEVIVNVMFHILKEKVTILGEPEETKDIQVFIAVHRAFANEEITMLRFHLFNQFFGKLTLHNLEKVCQQFPQGYKEVETALKYCLKDRIYAYIKKQTPPFYILQDILKKNRGRSRQMIEHDLETTVLSTCSLHYDDISTKVKRAIVRSVFFLFLTKALFALAVEGSFESIAYGKVMWSSIGLNTMIPPLLMMLAALFIKTPGKENSLRIYERIKSVLFTKDHRFCEPISLSKIPQYNIFLEISFVLLWIVACVFGFGVIIFVLRELHFNLLSQGVFVFFVAVVSFLSYRINQTARMYTIGDEKQNIGSVLFDFFFMPFIQVGRQLTVGISQFNILIFILDFIIEAPFKGIFAFFEHWFFFLHTQREKLE